MRKFTKEIKALIASAAVSAATGACIVSADSEGTINTAEKAAEAAETVCTTTEIPPLGGVTIPPCEIIQPTTITIITSTAGVAAIPDDLIEPVTSVIPTDILPPLGGVPTVPDEWIEPTTEEVPPATTETTVIQDPTEAPTGEVTDKPEATTTARPEGDADGDGKLDVRDAAHIAKMLAQGLGDKIPPEADFNRDGKINVRDAAAIAKFLAEGEK